MNKNVSEVTTLKKAIETYQCIGCVSGSNTKCYVKGESLACGNHIIGTTAIPIGKIFLGLPTGFNRCGPIGEDMQIHIYEKFADVGGYDKFNIPVWKYKDKLGNVIVRGLSPRVNFPFLNIFLEDCLSDIECLEITDKDLEEMD